MNQEQDDNRVVIIKTDHPDQGPHGCGAFYVKDHNLVFCIGDNTDIDVPGKKAVGAHDYFIRKILREALCVLDDYLRGRVDDRAMYGTERFWQDALIYAGRTIVPNTLWSDYRGVPYGFLIFHTESFGTSLCYNFVDGNYLPQDDKGGGKCAASPVELCYHGLLDQMLAQRHAGAGTAPGAYMEIAAINAYLKSKRSVRAIWPDGTVRQSFERRPLHAAHLLCIKHGRFEANAGGYRETPRAGEGLPTVFRHDLGEYRVNIGILESLTLTAPGSDVPNPQGQSNLIEKISKLIPYGTWFPFCKVKLTTAQGHTETVLHPSNPEARPDLLEMDAVRAFLRKHSKKNGLQAIIINYCVGAGAPSPMPDGVFALLEQAGYWQWRKIPGFGEGSPRTMEFDEGFLEEFLGENDDGGDKDTPADRNANNLMPPSVIKRLKASPIPSKDGLGKKSEVAVKYFNPSGAGTWLITEGEEQENGDWLLFGMCHIFEWEWGYVQLSDLQRIKAPPFGLGIERDLYSSGTVEELMGDDAYDAA